MSTLYSTTPSQRYVNAYLYRSDDFTFTGAATAVRALRVLRALDSVIRSATARGYEISDDDLARVLTPIGFLNLALRGDTRYPGLEVSGSLRPLRSLLILCPGLRSQDALTDAVEGWFGDEDLKRAMGPIADALEESRRVLGLQREHAEVA